MSTYPRCHWFRGPEHEMEYLKLMRDKEGQHGVCTELCNERLHAENY